MKMKRKVELVEELDKVQLVIGCDELLNIDPTKTYDQVNVIVGGGKVIISNSHETYCYQIKPSKYGGYKLEEFLGE